MLLSSLLFAGMGVFVKLGSAQLSVAELLFYRSMLGLAISFLLLRSSGVSLRTSHWRGHVARGLVGFAIAVAIALCHRQLFGVAAFST